MRKWLKKEIDFLKKEYPNQGLDFCAEKLNRSKSSINGTCNRHSIYRPKDKISEALKKVCKTRIKYSHLFDCQIPEFCYLLGYIWADGHVFKKGVNLRIIESDGIVVKNILDSFSIKYTCHKMNVTKGNHLQYHFNFGIELGIFLTSLDYTKKSFISHKKIMEFIPKQNLHYWVRGYFDGDGCFYNNDNHQSRRASIGSTYEQDWNYLNEFIQSIGLKPYIVKMILKNGRGSSFRIYGKNNVSKFGDYLYQGKQFGLTRKYEKYLYIKNVKSQR